METEISRMGNLQTAQTWNGAQSYGSIHDPLVELYFKSVRHMKHTDYQCVKVRKSKKNGRFIYPVEGKSIEEYFDAAWEKDPERALRFVFHLRDCRGGKGERALFRALIRHLRETGREKHVVKNMEHIPFFGSWKDVNMCFIGTCLEKQALTLIAKQLKNDQKSEKPSLCAKYAPSEGGAIDNVHKTATKLAKELNISLTGYRKKYLVPLRAKLNIVEREMCAKQWEEIKYETVPSLAGSKYKKAFRKHDEDRYSQYLVSVQKGEKKMNTSVLMPYQMVRPYLTHISEKDETLEAQWSSFVKERKEKWPAGINVMPLVDVSGSMEMGTDPRPMDVAVALGMLFSTLNSSEQYRNKFITFHEHPELLHIEGESLYEKVRYMENSKWGGSTNFQSAFDLMLNIATTFKIPKEQMPQILLVLSDMQFNMADRKTNWEALNEKYKKAGYDRPMIIFWNLNGTTLDYPIPDSKIGNCMLLSGYNDTILYQLLDGKMPNPLEIVHKVLDSERYSRIILAE